MRKRSFSFLLVCSLFLGLIGLGPSNEVLAKEGEILAPVMIQNDIWGFINEKGETVINFQYDKVLPFSENGLAMVGTITSSDDKGNYFYDYKFIDTKGNTVIDCSEYDLVHGFSEGLAVVAKNVGSDENGTLQYSYGYINEKGKQVIDASQYDFVYDFSEGLARVEKAGEVQGADGHSYGVTQVGYINKKGEEVIPLGKYYTGMQEFGFKEGFTLVGYFDESATGYPIKECAIDKKGNRIGEQYQGIGYFTNGYAMVESADGLWGFMNKKGKEVVAPQYKQVYNFNEYGTAIVKTQDDQGLLIDTKGKEVLSTPYSIIESCIDPKTGKGFALASNTNGDCGLINAEGEMIVPFEYESGRSILAGSLAIFFDGNAMGAVNEKGEVVVPFEYDSISTSSENGLYLLTKDSGFPSRGGYKTYDCQFINKKGEVVIPEAATSGDAEEFDYYSYTDLMKIKIPFS